MKVKTAELKNRLSHYLRLVEQGETITVMLRNKPVATLSAIRPLKAKEHPDATWTKEREALMAEADKLGIKMTIPLKRPRRVIPRPTPAPDGRTDINSVIEMRQEKDY